MSGDLPSFKKVVGGSYLRGAALGIAAATLKKLSKPPAAAAGRWTLVCPEGEVGGNMVVKPNNAGSTTLKGDLSGGWGQLVKLAGYQDGDEIECTFDEDARRMTFTILSRGNDMPQPYKNPEALAKAEAREAKRQAKLAAKEARRVEKYAKRAQREAARAANAAQAGGSREAGRKRKRQVGHGTPGQQQQQQELAQADANAEGQEDREEQEEAGHKQQPAAGAVCLVGTSAQGQLQQDAGLAGGAAGAGSAAECAAAAPAEAGEAGQQLSSSPAGAGMMPEVQQQQQGGRPQAKKHRKQAVIRSKSTRPPAAVPAAAAAVAAAQAGPAVASGEGRPPGDSAGSEEPAAAGGPQPAPKRQRLARQGSAPPAATVALAAAVIAPAAAAAGGQQLPAVALVGQQVYALNKHSGRWGIGEVEAVTSKPNSSSSFFVAVGPPGSEDLQRWREEQVRAALRRPGGLMFAAVEKDFGGTLYGGTAVDYDAQQGYYHVMYDDEDSEELSEEELLAIMTQLSDRHSALNIAAASGGAALNAAASAHVAGGSYHAQQQPKRRGRKPKVRPEAAAAGAGALPAAATANITPDQAEGGPEAAAATTAELAAAAAPPHHQQQQRSQAWPAGRQQQQQQATLTGGSRRTYRRMSLGSRPQPVLEDVAGSWQAPEVQPEGQGLFAACGAGHARGVAAYDDKDRCWRPVGAWLADRERGTLLGRKSVDLRHLEEGVALERRSVMVPGWIGVRVASAEEQWTPGYEGHYLPVIWDSMLANKRVFPACLACGTAEEAARLYDKVAVAYYGPELADTNYPITQELLAELGPREVGEAKSAVMCVLPLLSIEQSLPYEALSLDWGASDWHDWEQALVEDHMFSFPSSSSAASMARKLKWLLRQVEEVAILPAARGDRLQQFLAACDSCTEIGHSKAHFFPDQSSCDICAFNLKGSARGRSYVHGSQTLQALLQVAEDCLLSQDALSALAAGEGDAAAEAAAQAEQRDYNRIIARARGRLAAAGAEADADSMTGEGKPRQQRSSSQAEKQQQRQERRGQRAAAGAGRGAAAAALPVRRASPSSKQQQQQQGGRPGRRTEPLPPGLRVVVVGAGVSGLKAAGDLQRAGAEVTVLEARERAGGRIHTHTLSHGGVKRNVDLGATFICGTDRTPPVNPILKYAVDTLGLETRPKHRDGPHATVVYGPDGQPRPQELHMVVQEKYGGLHEELLERGLEFQRRGLVADKSMHDTAQAIMDDWEEAGELSKQEREIMDAYLCDLYVTTMDKLSLRGMLSEGYHGDHELVVGGYKQVIDALVRGVAEDRSACPLRDLRTGHVVTKIELLPGGVGARVHVDGQEPLGCDAVVCTLPLGVLQKERVAFQPPLPQYKRDAIKGLGMGTENRVAMLFSKCFWPEAPHFLRPMTGRYTYANYHALGVENVLSAWVRPQHVEEWEKLSLEEALADVEAHLRQLFPDTYEPPLDYAVTAWRSDPFSYGAYSYVPVGGTKTSYLSLSCPVTGVEAADKTIEQNRSLRRVVHWQTRLYFAGEATHRDDAYTVHGAYDSGKREAARICQWWREFYARVREEGEKEKLAKQVAAQAAAQVAEGAEQGGRAGRAAALAARSRLALAVE